MHKTVSFLRSTSESRMPTRSPPSTRTRQSPLPSKAQRSSSRSLLLQYFSSPSLATPSGRPRLITAFLTREQRDRRSGRLHAPARDHNAKKGGMLLRDLPVGKNSHEGKPFVGKDPKTRNTVAARDDARLASVASRPDARPLTSASAQAIAGSAQRPSTRFLAPL